MKFTKMHGLSNDFLLTHDVKSDDVGSVHNKIAFLCDRRRGVGGDGVIFVLPPTMEDHDFRMRIFNSDGSEAQMCGNGIRCFARYVKEKGLTSQDCLSIQTLAGTIKTSLCDNDNIRVTMGNPILTPSKIPVAIGGDVMKDYSLDIDGKTFNMTAVSMGNPHAVSFVSTLSDELVQVWGAKIESHSLFPQRVNAEFIRVIHDNEIEMRVYERGCGETFACGTGACASVVAGIITGRTKNNVTVHLLGGDLSVEWDGYDAHPVYMTGPAAFVFEGNIDNAVLF